MSETPMHWHPEAIKHHVISLRVRASSSLPDSESMEPECCKRDKASQESREGVKAWIALGG